MSSANTVLSTGTSPFEIPLNTPAITVPTTASNRSTSTSQKLQQQLNNTFQPAAAGGEPLTSSTDNASGTNRDFLAAFHQSDNSDITKRSSAIELERDQQQQKQAPTLLGRLDGLVSSPSTRLTKIRAPDSKKITAILLETNVVELQRHLLTLTVQNQVSNNYILKAYFSY